MTRKWKEKLLYQNYIGERSRVAFATEASPWLFLYKHGPLDIPAVGKKLSIGKKIPNILNML